MTSTENIRRSAGLLGHAAGALAIVGQLALQIHAADPTAIDFNRDVRPILSDHCFQCHGPDEAKREAELRLDREEGLFAKRDGKPIIARHQASESELYRRITAEVGERMPPPETSSALTARQQLIIKQWIEQGAVWQRHWSFIPPVRPPQPPVSNEAWCQNPIDRFVLARLEQAQLTPSPPADKATLIRRLSLDLTGIPPTAAEVDAFLSDQDEQATERVVDRLLKSRRFGERMAMRWLDLARYADTSGYQNDGPRQMWRWRDWVISAYNQNMPFDQFSVEQLAGDLLDSHQGFLRGELHALSLDSKTRDRLIATAFNRNHRGNAEGGIIPEEYQVEYVVDRVDTTATVWLGLTLGCARCHDHKYDPIKQEEFYRVFSFFNNVPEYGRAVKEGNSPPYMLAPTEDQLAKLRSVRAELRQLKQSAALNADSVARAQREWEPTVATDRPIDWTITEGLVGRFTFDGDPVTNMAGDADTGIKHDGASFVARREGRAIDLPRDAFVDVGDVGKFGYFDAFTLAAWVKPRSDGTIVSRMTAKPQGDGYYLHLEQGRLQFNLVKRWLDDSIRVETEQPVERDRWQHVAVTYGGGRIARSIRIFVNGVEQKIVVSHDFLNQSMVNDEPLRIGAGHAPLDAQIDDVRVYDRALKPDEVAVIATDDRIDEIIRIDQTRRTDAQREKLKRFYLVQAADEPIRSAWQRSDSLQKQERSLIAAMPTVMIMQEQSVRRATFVLDRGQYNLPKQKVQSGVPAALSSPDSRVRDRLAFARWIVSKQNPLTARVAVNRVWQMLFGEGIVRTMEDFGAQGERPTHPELLDWLAVEFRDNGWDLKRLLKKIVMSATYQQSSRVDAEMVARDPANRLLARQIRFRLPAEIVRDQALAASGLLHERLGGPSVKPYQPDGLWQEIATDTHYELSTPPDIYRRSLYTYWKRTVAPPTMTTFDATARELCTVRRARTNTPLQALAIMNDDTYVEAARALAARMIQQGPSPSRRIAFGFRCVLVRQPNVAEAEQLEAMLRKYRSRFARQPAAAEQLLSVGSFQPPLAIGRDELAAYTLLASVILNLDEAVTRE